MNLLKKRRRGGDGQHQDLVPARRAREDRAMPTTFRDFREEMDRAFERMWRGVDVMAPWLEEGRFPALTGLADWPAMDVAEDDEQMTIRVDVPGLEAKDVDVEVSGHVLSIRGQRQDEWTDRKGGMIRCERRAGNFARTVTLPEHVDPEKMQARYDKGTLTIQVPVVPGRGRKRITVQT